MSDNEMDQIGRESSRALRQIIDTARTFIEMHRNRHRYSGVRKLTRRERRDLAEAVRVEVGERRIAGAWADLRVSDYHREARELDWARNHSDLSREDNQQWLAERTDRLDAIRHRIEHTLHTTALPLEQRGQVVQALDQIERRPAAVRIERLFTPLDDRSALAAREAAVTSERRTQQRQTEIERGLAAKREQQQRTDQARQLDTEAARLRAQLAGVEARRGELGTDGAAPFVASVGPEEYYGRDHDPALASVPHQDRPRTASFVTREQAQQWVAERLNEYENGSSRRDGQFVATMWDSRNPGPTGQSATGPLGMVRDEVATWGPQQAQQRQRPPDRPTETRPTQPIPAPEPVAQEAKQPDRLAEIERELRGLREDRDQLARRVEILQRGVDAVTADRDDHKRKLAAATAQVEALKNANLGQTRELEELRQNGLKLVKVTVDRDRFKTERDQYLSERDKFKAERDEAVQKLAQSTPQRDRFGSAERIDADAKLGDTAPMPREVLHEISETSGNGHGRPTRNGIERSR
ncbi:hypothetical protein [Nocardia nova]|uniref:hypothetical protein n=1 Tax=Nocardia nova TaxID=37330 RepID=UPI0011B06B8C|nr:hypothetical protein [Nocardia nova]